MSHVGTETGLLNIENAALKRIGKYCGKKKVLQKKKKKYTKHFLKVKKVLLFLKTCLLYN